MSTTTPAPGRTGELAQYLDPGQTKAAGGESAAIEGQSKNREHYFTAVGHGGANSTESPVEGEDLAREKVRAATEALGDTLAAVIPDAMRRARRWLVYKLIPNPDPTKKPRKVPFYLDGTPRRGALDTPADLAKLGTFDEARTALKTGRYAGLGFALGQDGEGYWQGIDLDHTDERPELAALADTLPGYVEWSPSGTGVHAIGYGRQFPALGSNASGIEAYSGGRFFTVTGRVIRGGAQ